LNEYLGHVNFKDKSVIELGPASGFLTFEIESRGAEVTSIELQLNRDSWDAVPNVSKNWRELERQHFANDVFKVQNAFWFAHHSWKSNAKVIYSNALNIPADIGHYDIGLIASVLVHTHDPFFALWNMLSHVREKCIITELLPEDKGVRNNIVKFVRKLVLRERANQFAQFLPNVGNEHEFAWWLLEPKTVIAMIELMGFELEQLSHHSQLQNGKPRRHYTIVAKRVVPLNECNF
jgi:O-methyltransferase